MWQNWKTQTWDITKNSKRDNIKTELVTKLKLFEIWKTQIVKKKEEEKNLRKNSTQIETKI